MSVSEQDLIEFIVGTGLASKKSLLEASEEGAKSTLGFERVLVMRGLVSERDLRRAKSYILNIPFVDLRGSRFDLAMLAHIPEPVSREHNVVAYKRVGDVLEVALLDLASLPEVKFAEELHRVRIVPRFTDSESMKHALVSYQEGLRSEYGDAIKDEARSLAPLKKDLDAHSDAELRALAEDPRVARIFASLLSHALLSRATNVHIEPTSENLRVRYRFGGALRDAAILPKAVSERLALRAKLLSGMSLKSALPQDGRFVLDTGAHKASLRISTAPTAHGEKIVMRILPESAAGFTLESLGLSGSALETLERALHKKEGLILACGPKGSGKSTFLYTAVDILNKPDLSIHTVEDPIEYSMPHVHQTQVDEAKGLTFARALRGAALDDTDVLMISDLREADTVKTACAAALSGELVLGGIFADSAADGLVSLLEKADDRKLLASALTASVGMRVVRKLGPERERYYLSADELRTLGHLVALEPLLEVMKAEGIVPADAEWERIAFWKPRKGQLPKLEFQGHIGLFEVIPATPRIRELVMNGASRTSITDEARVSGALTLLEDGVMKAVQGLTTIEEVVRAVS